MDGTIQLRYSTDLTVEDYVSQQAWWKASPPPCPFHRSGGCRLVPHGTYPRLTPPGVRVRRFRCPGTGKTVSLLPDCLASHLRGSLEQVEHVVRSVEQAQSVERAADQLRRDPVVLETAIRWVQVRLRRVRAVLAACCTLYPQRFGQLELTLEAFSGALGDAAVLVSLRAVAADRLGSLPTPVGFLHQRDFVAAARSRPLQHAHGVAPRGPPRLGSGNPARPAPPPEHSPDA